VTRKREPCVVDTNVAVAADRRATAGSGCVRACIAALREIIDGKRTIVIDDGGEIVREYRNNLYTQGQPGIGAAFLKWIWDFEHNSKHCDRVKITRKQDPADDFEEFPSHDGLKQFDLADRKFVAVSAKHPARPTILEATDTKWWGWKDALAECGIRVHFLCEAEIAERYKQKFEK